LGSFSARRSKKKGEAPGIRRQAVIVVRKIGEIRREGPAWQVGQSARSARLIYTSLNSFAETRSKEKKAASQKGSLASVLVPLAKEHQGRGGEGHRPDND